MPKISYKVLLLLSRLLDARDCFQRELSSVAPGLLALAPRLDVPLDRSRRRLLELSLAAGRERRLIGRLPLRTASRDHFAH